MFSMRRAAPLILATVLVASGLAAPATGARPSAQGVTSTPDTTIDAEITLPQGVNWPTVGGNLTDERYSTLDQISTSNVSQLKPAWMIHLINPSIATKYWSKYTQEATPVVQDGIMYITTGNDDVFAINAATGARLWTYTSHTDQKNDTVCCGWDNRGVALGQGMLFLGRLDGSVVALQAATGEQLWKNQLVRWQDGYNITAAPVYYDGMVFVGTVGGEFGTRGRLYGLDANTGKVLWTFYTTAAPGQVGGNSWPNDGGFAYQHGGAPIWDITAIDPQLGLLYFSTGNAGPDFYGGGRAGANLFAASVVALHYKTGKLAWYFQEVHHDIWDFDTPSPPVLYDIMIHGQMRQAIAEAGKTGWIYILDRATGKPLIGITEKPVPQFAEQSTYPTQPYPVGDALVPQCGPKVKGFLHVACIFDPVTTIDTVFQPLYSGGVVWTPMTYSPQTQYLYTEANYFPADATLKNTPFVKGKFYAGAGASNPLLGVHYYSNLSASNAATNRIAWQVKVPYQDLGNTGGAITTAGGLLFVGLPDGLFEAYNAKTGKLLWKFQTGYGTTAPPITYDVNGTQYVAIDAGGQTGAAPIGKNNKPLYGDALWVFSLKGAVTGKPIQPLPVPKPASNVVAITGTPYRTTLVDMVDYGYEPVLKGKPVTSFGAPIITVPVGTTITFLNTGLQPHTATSVAGGFDTGLVAPGGKASVTMGKVGTFTFTCIPHPWMLAEVIVTAKGAPAPAGTIGAPI